MSTPEDDLGEPPALPPSLPPPLPPAVRRRVPAWTPSIKAWVPEHCRAIGALYALAAICQLACFLYVLDSCLETYRLKDSSQAVSIAFMTLGLAVLWWVMVLAVKAVGVGLLGASVVMGVAGFTSFRFERFAKFRYVCALVSVFCLPAATMVGCRALGVMVKLPPQPLPKVVQ